jgi:hypothetical protein
VILFKGKIDILSLIEVSGFLINRMLCILFSTQYRIPGKQKRKKLALKSILISLSLLYGFIRLLTGDSCGLSLEAKQSDNLRFTTTQS